MLVSSCPNCGTELRFKSTALPVKVCDFCRSTVVRSGEDLQAMGKVAMVPEDVSPLQIGTRGLYNDVNFEIVGRIRWRWEDGGWNEWVMLFDDGAQGWLGETMGRFMVLFEYPGCARQTKVVKKLIADEPVQIGTGMTVDDSAYAVNDIRMVECAGSEGELPFSTPIGLKMMSVDLASEDGRCASVQKDRGQVAVYQGRYTTLARLRATNLRRVEGWTLPVFAHG